MAAAGNATAFAEKTLILGRELLRRGLDTLTGKTIQEVGIEYAWVEAYAMITERVEHDRKCGLSRHKFEPSTAIVAMAGGFFDNKEWPLRKALAQHPSMRAVADHEAKYINCTGYWLMFHEAAPEKGKDDEAVAQRLDVWEFLAVQYAIRCLGLRTQFYELAAEDPTYEKLVIPALEKESQRAHADNLDKPMATLDSHMSTQLMKAVATLNASNATRRAGRGGGAAGRD